jgi:hypothetical protein
MTESAADWIPKRPTLAALGQRDGASWEGEMQLIVEDLRLVAAELQGMPDTAYAMSGTKLIAPVEVASAIHGPETGVLDLAWGCGGNRSRCR